MTLPRIQPIAPTWRKTPFDDPDWLFDLKYDGFRGLCYLDRGRNRLISRNNNVMTRFEALADQIASLLDVHDAILDGEVIAADETGRPMFCDLLRRARAAAYVAFDIIWLNGHGSTVPTAARAPAAAANGVAEGLADRISAGIRYRQGMRAVRSDVRE